MVEPALERIVAAEGKFSDLTRYRIRSIDQDTVTVSPTYAGPDQTIAGETVVLVTPNEPLRELYNELNGKVGHLAIVGDANSPRNLQKAIFEGHTAARSL